MIEFPTLALSLSPIDQLNGHWLDVRKLSYLIYVIPIFISLLQIAFTFLRFDCNSGEVSLPWHCEEKCNRNCDENSVSLILTMWCLLLKVVALDFGFNMCFSIVPYWAAMSPVKSDFVGCLLWRHCRKGANEGFYFPVSCMDRWQSLTHVSYDLSDLHLFDLLKIGECALTWLALRTLLVMFLGSLGSSLNVLTS